MKIETKYNTTERVWVVELIKSQGKPVEVVVYSDTIKGIVYEDGEVYYYVGENLIDLKEDEMIAYDDLIGLANKIKSLDDEIISREEE